MKSLWPQHASYIHFLSILPQCSTADNIMPTRMFVAMRHHQFNLDLGMGTGKETSSIPAYSTNKYNKSLITNHAVLFIP
jgi:hypothetical protein